MNIAYFIEENASRYAQKQAIVSRAQGGLFSFGSDRTFQSCTFDELHKKSNVFANAFTEAGIGPGVKTLVFVTPSLDFPCIIFALFKIGAVPVFIDPGMGVDSLLECVQNVQAKALVGISKILYLRSMKRKFFAGINILVNVDGNFWGTHSLKKISKDKSNQFTIFDKNPKDLSAILFTSGGTGLPKGVEYTTEMFWNQTKMLKECFRLAPDDRDYPGFPLFGLFTLALGLTTHVCSFDASKPAGSNPKKVVRDLAEFKITFAAGSPSIWKNVADYCSRKKITVETLKVLAMFGAPVRHELLKTLKKVFPQANIYTPYGATECLPISVMSAHEVLGETKEETQKGKGVCVGYLVKGVEVKIIPRTDHETNAQNHPFLKVGEVGEIVVHSPTMTPGYHGNDEASKIIKHKDGDRVWHRMGDIGYLDSWGRLWFLGRKSHCVENDSKTYYPVSVEGPFNDHPDVLNSALIKVNDRPALAILRNDRKTSLSLAYQEKFFSELEVIAKKNEETRGIELFVLFENFPVDTRHNIKIDRIKLGLLAAEKINQIEATS